MIYATNGVCSREIEFDIIDNKLTNVRFIGGCSGNTQGVARLVEGMDIDAVISRLNGIRCGFRPTSCPDQLANALKQYKAKLYISTLLFCWYSFHPFSVLRRSCRNEISEGQMLFSA